MTTFIRYSRYVGLAVAAFALSHCGGESGRSVSGPAGSFDGSMPGAQPVFVPQDAIFRPAIPNSWPPGPVIFITDYSWACADEASYHRVANSHTLEISLPNSSGDTISTGAYDIIAFQLNNTDPIAIVTYDAFDATCDIVEKVEIQALSGSLIIDSSSASQVTGHFNMRFQSNLTLSGQFSANGCPSLQAKYASETVTYLGTCGAAVSCSSTQGDSGTPSLPPGCP